MKPSLYSRFKVGLALGSGALLALILCVQCIQNYLYTDAVLVPQLAQHEAERQAFAVNGAARSAGANHARTLSTVMEHTLESASDRLLWMRVLDEDGHVFAQAVSPGTAVKFLAHWREQLEKHLPVGSLVNTSEGKALVSMFPFRMPRAARPSDTDQPPINRRGPGYLIEVAVPIKGVTGAFDGLREHLIVGMTASITLLIALAVIGLRAPQYLRGKHLEGELLLARLVQRDLQPKPRSLSADLAFAASAVAADHVGGDFYDIFEASPGKTAIVLGDVSGKGVSAALLVSVLQGAIRSSTSARHESACDQINRMLCELTAHARFATLFWGIYDSESGILRYVNAGHAAPMLIRHGKNRLERLDHGGPVLGLLPSARYSAGSVRIEGRDTLVVYSDGVSEAAKDDEEEFGENRLRDLISLGAGVPPAELCKRIMSEVNSFASKGPAPDDRTLMVVDFQRFPNASPWDSSQSERNAFAKAVA